MPSIYEASTESVNNPAEVVVEAARSFQPQQAGCLSEEILQVKEAPRLMTTKAARAMTSCGNNSAAELAASSASGYRVNNRYAASMASASITALAKNVGREIRQL
jgi:hypothetical protein